MQKRGISEKAPLVVAWMLYFLVLFELTFVAQSGFDRVFIGTLPFLLYLIVFFFDVRKYRYILWILPFLFPLGFYLIWQSQAFPYLNQMDGPQLAVFNLVLSYIGALLYFLFHQREKTIVKHREHEHNYYEELAKNYHEQQQHYLGQIHYLRQQVHKQAERKDDFTLNLKSIEDKCKAINFVIGRVYSEKRGGSRKIRETLSIDRELYNTFSELSRQLSKETSFKLLQILKKIYAQLKQLEQQERQLAIFITQADIPVKRTALGKDKIIDVLANNDKDPVKDYHTEAKEICIKLNNYIKVEYSE